MATPEITDDPDWTEGNFEITSRDNVRFRIKEYHLYWARWVENMTLLTGSEVFAEAHSERFADKTIEFTGPELETAAVLRVFFTTITAMRVPLAQFECKDLSTLTNFLFFVRKCGKNIYAVALDGIHTAVKAKRLFPLRGF